MKDLPDRFSDLTSEQRERMVDMLVERARGTATEPSMLMQQCELPDAWAEHVEELLLDGNVEACDGCGWWCGSDELVDEDSEVVGCEQCR